MRYHHILIIEYESNMWTIILTWGMFIQKTTYRGYHLTRNFPGENEEMSQGFEFYYDYIDNQLFITAGYWLDQLGKLEIIINTLK